MIWVTWRQQRAQILAVFGVVLVLAAVLVYVRIDAVPLLPDRALVIDRYQSFLQYFALLLLVMPCLLGMFTGSPLFAREIERGTHVLGLTQSISRGRWLGTKLLVAGGSLAVATMGLGLVAAWALGPIAFVLNGRMLPMQFEIQGVVFGAYAILSFAVGATAGLVLRNTLASMVTTLLVFTVLFVVIANTVRSHYAAPTSFVLPVERGTRMVSPPEGWGVDYGFLDASGQEIEIAFEECPGPADFVECVRGRGAVAQFARAHLPNQFWRFQFTELGLLLVLSGAVLGAGVLASRRRLV